MNRKGFTIVELVIVIAVVAILAAVLIPTFSNVIENANKSAALQAANAAYTEAMAEVAATNFTGELKKSGFTFTFNGSTIANEEVPYNGDDDNLGRYKYTVEDDTNKIQIVPETK